MISGFLPTMPYFMKLLLTSKITRMDVFTTSPKVRMKEGSVQSTQLPHAMVSKWKYHTNLLDGFLPTMPCTMKQSWMIRIINKDAFTIS